MLGGGNPAQIPEMEAYFKQLCQEMLDQGKLTEALCNYDGPQGKDALLKRWPICCARSSAGRSRHRILH